MEMSERLENHTHWNPGIVPSTTPSQPEVWQTLQPECLMSGGTPGEMFYPLGHGQHQFRRFPLHFGGSEVMGHHHGDILQENSGEGNAVPGQDGHQMIGHHVSGIEDCSDECSEDEEDEEEEEDDMQIDSGYVHGHQGMGHSSLGIEEEPLQSCQQSHQLRGEVGLISGGMDSSCHQKGTGMLPHVHHDIEEEMPTINQGHPLNSNPISAIPMITGNCGGAIMMPEHQLVGNTTSQGENSSINMTMSDPSNCSNGQSVHGKMYVENNVVFHLKQWTDSGFGNFNSCREQQQQKNQLYRCAVCQLRAPHNGFQPKDTHRHPIRGVMLSFEDCIILELYPEHPEHYPEDAGLNNGQEPLRMDPKQSLHVRDPSDPNKDDRVTSMAYYNNPPDPEMSNMVDPSNGNHSSVKAVILPQDHNQSWWGYDSSQREIDERVVHHQTADSCAINLKLNAQRYHDALEEQESSEVPEMHENHQQNSIISSEQDMLNQERRLSYEDECYTGDQNVISASSNPNPLITLASKDEQGDCSDVFDCAAASPIEDNANIPSTPEFTIKPVEPSTAELSESPCKLEKKKNKYPCPCCKKCFRLKSLLKDHLEEKHVSGNPYQCTLCKMQYADSKRLQRHSCTLNVDTVKHRLKIKEISDLPKKTVPSLPSTDPCSMKNDVNDSAEIILPKSSKIRKFSEKSNKTKKNIQPDDSEDKSSSNSSNIDNVRLPKNISLSTSFDEDGENIKTNADEEEDLVDIEKQNKKSSSPASTSGKHELTSDPRLLLDVNEKSKEFKCNVCGKCFTVERRLLNHAACHKPERSSQCDKCGKRFARRDKLMRHMYVHVQEKMFACDICEKRFSRRDKLSDHLKSHQTDEIHQCPMCEKQFLRPDILKQHVKMHQMHHKHQCPDCLRFVTGKDRLAQHMKRHEEAKALGQTLLCPLCTKYFIQRQSLKAHIRKFHPDAVSQLNQLLEPSSNGQAIRQHNDNNHSSASPSPSTSSTSSSNNDPKSPLPAFSKTVTKHSDATTSSVTETILKPSKQKQQIKKEQTQQTSGKFANRKAEAEKYSCRHCLQRFSQKQDLKDHEISKHSSMHVNGNGPSKKKSDHAHKTVKRSEEMNYTKKVSAVEEGKSNPSRPTEKFKSKKKIESQTTSSSSNKKIPPSVPAASGLAQPLKLPSCASLTTDLSFNLNSHPNPISSVSATFPHQSQPIAYSHHFALTMVGAGLNIPHLQNPCVMPPGPSVMESVLNNRFLYSSNGGDIGNQPSSTLLGSSTSAYVTNYPTGMSYQDQ